MSINFLGLGTIGTRDVLKSYVREHASKMVIIGIMFGISVGVAVLATGDITEAVARSRGH
jgi:glycerol uptake facilitator-like aquaporin